MSRTAISPGFHLVSVRGGGRVVVRDVDDPQPPPPPVESGAPRTDHKQARDEAPDATGSGGSSLEDAYQQGYTNAQAECAEKHAAEIAALQAQMAIFSKQLPQHVSDYLRELERQICAEVFELGTALAEYIVPLEAPRKLEIREVVEAALNPLLSLDDVTLHVCPEQAQLLAEDSNSGMPASVKIVPDPSLGPGDVFAETPNGRIDATLSGRLNTLKDALGRSVAGLAETT